MAQNMAPPGVNSNPWRPPASNQNANMLVTSGNKVAGGINQSNPHAVNAMNTFFQARGLQNPFGVQQATSPAPAPPARTERPVERPVSVQTQPMPAPAGGQPPTPQMPYQVQSQAADVYTPTMTQQAVNQARAQAAMSANPEWIARQYDRPGMLRSGATMARVVPQVAQASAQGDFAASQIPFQHGLANQQNALAGQVQGSQQAQGLANIGAGMEDAAFNAWIQQQGLNQGYRGLGQDYRGLGQGYRGLGQQYLGQGISDHAFAQNEQINRQNQLMNMLFQGFGAV